MSISHGSFEHSHSSQCSTTGVTKVVVCAILSVGVVHIKDSLLPLRKSSLLVVAACFLFHYLCGPLPYVRRHKTVNKMCGVHR